MHILFLIGDMRPQAGGPPQVVAGSAAALVDRGHQVTIATLGEEIDQLIDFYPLLNELGVVIRPFRRSAFGIPGSSRAMAHHAAMAIDDYDVLHVHGVWEGCGAQVAAIFRKHGKPVYVSAHGMLDHWSMAQSRARKWVALHLTGIGTMLRRADAIVFGSSDERDEGASVTHTRGVVIPNGVDSDALTPDRLPDARALTDRFPVQATWTHTILYFSRIHPKKGLDLLVDALINLAPRFPGAGLLVLGIPQDAAFQRTIEDKIAAAGLAPRFAITTDLSGAPAKMAFRLADIFALPSHQEGFSMAIIEALALGMPVLITDKCHLPEIAVDGAGEVVSDDAEGIRTGLAALLARSPDELKAMGAKGALLVRERYDWRTIAKQLQVLYQAQRAP